jgi:hypothetical protein
MELKQANHSSLQMQQVQWNCSSSSSWMLLRGSSPGDGSPRGLLRHQQQIQLPALPMRRPNSSYPRCPSEPVLLLHL